jgi:hypothetical protein
MISTGGVPPYINRVLSALNSNFIRHIASTNLSLVSKALYGMSILGMAIRPRQNVFVRSKSAVSKSDRTNRGYWYSIRKK